MSEINNNGIGNIGGLNNKPNVETAKPAKKAAAATSPNTSNSTQALNLTGQALTQASIDGAIHRGNEVKDSGAFEDLNPLVQKLLDSASSAEGIANPSEFAQSVLGSSVEAAKQAGKSKLMSWAQAA